MKTYSPIRSGDDRLNRIQDRIAEAFRSIQEDKFLSRQQINGIALDTTPTVIGHGLGRIPSAWQVVDRNAAQAVFRLSWTDATITLQASGPVTVNLEVW